MQITKHKATGISYTLTDETGTVLEKREPMTPLFYLHGEGLLLPGLEAALEGKQADDTFEVTLPPDQAYGERDPELVEQISRDTLGDQPVAPGQQLHGSLEQVATIVDVGPDTITVDANHPLAGKTLRVSGQVVSVRDAVQEEIVLGRANGQDDDSLLVWVRMRAQKDTE